MNEKRVFSDPAVIAKLQELNVELVRADNTRKIPEIKTDLNRFNRSNLPVNIIVPSDPDQPLIMMPEVISPKEALQALEEAQG